MSIDVLEAIKNANLGRFLDSSGRGNFKIPVSAFPEFPLSVQTKLNTLKKTSSTFDGKKMKVNRKQCSS